MSVLSSVGQGQPTFCSSTVENMYTREETHMDPDKGPLEDDFPLQPSGFQVACGSLPGVLQQHETLDRAHSYKRPSIPEPG